MSTPTNTQNADSNALVITTPDGDFSAFVALPKADSAPVIVVIQEIFGINADMRETCRQLAALGYIAVCPDLYWRQEPGVSLTDQTQDEWNKAMTFYTAFDVDAGVSDIAATISAALKLPGASGKVGAVGYCLGGLLAYLTATRTDADAAVAYYGVGIDQHLDEAANINQSLLMHIAEEDEFVPPETRQRILTALQGNHQVDIHLYPGCNHAFARNAGAHYDAVAARLANARTAEFFDKHLK
ncbi:dienelactone hydrolase family protein [Pseudomonas cavernicola]|uniref:Dienelactone hydrolase family protein n=1 Tax=Pseudomonas cavernicola TaxID=2320866 RepID=A0A418XI10_9PSED|nr:dienelactone hydrolase family protein [Pseudomonas cavernicola]RJG12065.1 dienelactone hydrolase family protein [Pseudomonas cavernicola]